MYECMSNTATTLIIHNGFNACKAKETYSHLFFILSQLFNVAQRPQRSDIIILTTTISLYSTTQNKTIQHYVTRQ